jgi:hypothetical protein
MHVWVDQSRQHMQARNLQNLVRGGAGCCPNSDDKAVTYADTGLNERM